jgi:hypothetical protein
LGHYAGVRVGVITERSGNPVGTDRWRWFCGFYPGSNPGEDRDGTAPTFDAARAGFETAWREYQPLRTEADFEEWWRHAAFTVEKYARWDRGERMPAGG